MPNAMMTSYTSAVKREDLLDVITNLKPTETQFFTGLKKSKAKSVYHEWPVDVYATVTNTATDKKTVEGADWGDGDMVSPTREGNYTQIIKEVWKISGTAQVIDTAGMSNPKAYYQAKAMINWKHKAEWSLIHGTKTAGDASTAREMGGIFNLTTTNAVNAGGDELTESLLLDYLQLGWEASSAKISECYVGADLKRVISSFTAGSTKNIEAKDKRLVNAVDVYESDFGIIKIFLHRFIDSVVTASGTHNMLLIAPETLAYAGLREPANYDAPKGGDYEKGAIIGEFTLEDRGEYANVAIKNLKASSGGAS